MSTSFFLTRRSKLLAIFLLLPTSHVLAIEPYSLYNMLGMEITPILKASWGVNDNLFLSDEFNKKTSFYQIEPQITTKLENNLTHSSINYRFERKHFFDSKKDNSNNHFVHASSLWNLDYLNKFAFDYQFSFQHEPRGFELTAGIPLAVETPLVYRTHKAFIEHAHGLDQSLSKFVFRLGIEEKNYKNRFFFANKDLLQSQFFEWLTPYLDSQFSTRISRFHSLVLSLHFDKRKYLNPNINFSKDSYNRLFHTGIQWDFSNKTQGYFLIGLQDKEFKNNQQSNFQGVNWQLSFNWQATKYSNIDFYSAFKVKDPNFIGDYIKEQKWELAWQHRWNSLFSTQSYAKYENINFQSSQRSDDNYQFKLTFIYHLVRNLDLFFSSETYSRNSSLAIYDSKQDLINLGIEIGL